MNMLWLKGLLARRPGRLLGTIAGVALTVALLSSIGAFVASSAASMTRQAMATVPVDWQVQLSPTADDSQVMKAIGAATGYTALQRVGYAAVSGFELNARNAAQTTGGGKVLGIGTDYQRTFPAEVRPLIGSQAGILLAQQTAANLHARPGDSVTIKRLGLPPAQVRVAGVVDLPSADSLFQAVGMPAGVAPQAPPDNVMLMPDRLWHKLFDPQAIVRPDSVRTQFHVRIAHDLPAEPGAAYFNVQRAANNLEARVAGSAVVGDNLAARLLGSQADALYARVLFIFLGIPGIVLAVLLTLSVAASGAERRRGEQGLLRTRGASVAQVVRLESLEALVVGIGGVLLGIVLAWGATAALGHDAKAVPAVLRALIVGGVSGFVLAAFAVLYPVWRQTRDATVASARSSVKGVPLWQQMYLDVILLTASALVFSQTAASGYQVVIATEGVPQTAVHYQTFIAPLCLWLGAALLMMRLWESLLNRGRRTVAILVRILAGGLAGAVAASLSRQRTSVTRGAVLAALAFSFAVSTSVFNTTYNAQSRVDAELTNGADVTVATPTGSSATSMLRSLEGIPGVKAAQPMQHRFAYVGNDLQDMFGIDAAHITRATNISDAFFGNHDAKATLATLGATPDGVLVSAETMRDFALHLGDRLNLRLQKAGDHRYHVIPFHFAGLVSEFPTAPKDSFFVANASYLAKQTGSSAAEVVLLRAASDPNAVARRARSIVASLPGVKVTDIGSTQRAISSSLTAVNLRGLTALELAFAIMFLAGATGLVLALGIAERRRTFAILSALGAKSGQLGAFLWSEALLILVGGGLTGMALGLGIAEMLVKILTGVFDPPPDALTIPWTYLSLLFMAALVSTALAVWGALCVSRRPAVEALRDV